VLLRRNDTTGEIAYYRAFSPRPVPLGVLVKVAGQRWRVEECFQTGKGLTGLDQHQVRQWRSWHRWVTLAMLAHAFLTVMTPAQRAAKPTPVGLIPITVNELRRLFDSLLLRPNHGRNDSTNGQAGVDDIKPEPAPATTDDVRITMITNYGCSIRPGDGSCAGRGPAAVSALQPENRKNVSIHAWSTGGAG
jgi:hypothetical protein